MTDHFNFFGPYDRGSSHEDQLTRAFFISLQHVPLAHAAWLTLVDRGHRQNGGDGVPFLHELPEPEFAIQRAVVPAPVDRVVSVIQTDEHYFLEDDVSHSERGQRLDGIVCYAPQIAIVVENKPNVRDVWAGQLAINLPPETRHDPRVASVRWQDVVEVFSNILAAGHICGSEASDDLDGIASAIQSTLAAQADAPKQEGTKQQMRAMAYASYGGPDRLALVDLPRPQAGPGQLLLRTLAVGVNPVDWKLASGALRFFARQKFPVIPGGDIAGEVVEVGSGVRGFQVGDRVHALIGYGGCSAEFVPVKADVAAKFPPVLDAAAAASLPLAGLTALQGLRDKGGLKMLGATGTRVLVVGASGGVGHLAVQIARAAGATVSGVCSSANADLVRELGAQDVLDYRKPEAWDGKGPWDIILDAVGKDSVALLKHLAPRGRLVSTLPPPGLMLRAILNPLVSRKIAMVMVKPDAAGLGLLDQLADSGQLRVVIDSRYPFEDLPKAWERSMTGHAVGKIVVEFAAAG